MPSPKSPQTILEHYKNFIGVNPMMLEDVRSSLASVILWCAEQMPKEVTGEGNTLVERQFLAQPIMVETKKAWNAAISDCRSILLQKADELTKE